MSETELDDLLLFVLVSGIDLAMGQPRMRHADAAIDARIERVVDRWHLDMEGEPRLLNDELPGWLLGLPRQVVPPGDEP